MLIEKAGFGQEVAGGPLVGTSVSPACSPKSKQTAIGHSPFISSAAALDHHLADGGQEVKGYGTFRE
jgi:hypothetical protein